MAPADCGGYAVARHAVSLATRLTVILFIFYFFFLFFVGYQQHDIGARRVAREAAEFHFFFFVFSQWAIGDIESALDASLAKRLANHDDSLPLLTSEHMQVCACVCVCVCVRGR